MTFTLCATTLFQAVRSYCRHPAIAWSQERRQWGVTAARLKSKRLGLTAMYQATPAGVYPPDWADLLNIYQLVLRRKPRVVVEFGSGCSTLAFAHALSVLESRGLGSGHLYSVETKAEFRHVTASYLPHSLERFVTFVDSDIAFGEVGGAAVMWHTKVPDVAPNLVYLDGPDYQDFSTTVKTQADGVLLESTAAADFAILIDGRKDTFQFTRDRLKRRYAVTVNGTHKWELFEALS